jgi:hypothetical protein
MIINDLKKLWPAGLMLTGILGFIAIPRELMNVGTALRDWPSVLPFGVELLPKLVFLALFAYGAWRYARLYAVPLVAHKSGLWKYNLISMVELAHIASERYQWDFRDSSLDQLDLGYGIGQACAEGRVQAHGRFNPQNFSGASERIYVVPIPVDYWRLNYVEPFDAFRALDNSLAVSCSIGDMQKREYRDLRLNRMQALAWLEREGSKWRGRSGRENGKKASGLRSVA